MQKRVRSRICSMALSCALILSAAAAWAEAPATLTDHPVRTVSEATRGSGIGCRRDRVVWSGGVARRGPDRLAPRPVRSKWQREDDSRIQCPELRSGIFRGVRVSDRPWMR